ncbi:MAG: hypothetical protein GF307_15085 [candidate division Zixibacteria bacterium]|nr:hypothetical protein [candidate division Zixibacteria bacterium]
MKWFRSLFESRKRSSSDSLSIIKSKFGNFISILDSNNKALKIMSDMEEKSQGDYLFDINYIRTSLADIRAAVQKMIDNMIALGGDNYLPLRERYRKIDTQLSLILPGGRNIPEDEFTIPFSRLNYEKAFSVGSKTANLGELTSRLKMPVPDGFAITGWAYKHFIDHNKLQDKISNEINALNIKSYSDLQKVSDRIQDLIMGCEVPGDLQDSIVRSYEELHVSNDGIGCCLRSSALGEDTQFSFAGQYKTILNIKDESLIPSYKEVVAGKFNAQAIYYLLSHSLSESELAMGVGCMKMVNSAKSGVIYTRNPVNSEDNSLLINSILGLGRFLVDGIVTPDIFHVDRDNLTIKHKDISHKPAKLIALPGGGTAEKAVPSQEQEKPSLTDNEVAKLAEIALKIEEHYGHPQDIEWAIDDSGEIYLLQSRPLHVAKKPKPKKEIDLSAYEAVSEGGVPISPGIGAGPAFNITSPDDLDSVPDGSVLVTPHSFPGIVAVMDRLNALVTRVGGIASHMATIAREFRVPTICAPANMCSLHNGKEITVDASSGIIYDGIQPELIEALAPEDDSVQDTDIYEMINKLLPHITPLNLVHPRESEFLAEKCETLHDITRFCHQRSMEEMFYGATEVKDRDSLCVELKTDIPLKVNLLYIDREPPRTDRKGCITVENIESVPLTTFWSGIAHEGWPVPPGPSDARGFAGVLATSMTRGGEGEFAENSFALISKEYMILSLRMGYHFTTIEAMITPIANNNYIRMQFKEGGAAIDRRVRRIRLITEILTKFGFENNSRQDFLDTSLTHQDESTTRKALYSLGRLTVLTKQLDMALSSDAITTWYIKDLSQKLGIAEQKADDDG